MKMFKLLSWKFADNSGNGEASPLLGVFLGVMVVFILVLAVLVAATRARCKRRMAAVEGSQAAKHTSGDQGN